MVQLHQRKRVELIVETAILPRVEQALRAAQVKGYTVVPCLKGYGAGGDWWDDEISQADRMVVVTAILANEALGPLLDAVKPLLESWRGVVSVSDVQVLRAAKF